jgi:hypothetical protein
MQKMRVEIPEEIDMRDLGRVFTHIHDQESEISERFYLNFCREIAVRSRDSQRNVFDK